MTTEKMPYVRFYMSDWLSATRGMKASEIGIYFTLLALMYERGEPLPEDYTRLSRQCGCTPKTCEAAVSMLINEGKITRVNGSIWNKRVQKEFQFREENSKHSSEAAKKRWEKTNESNGENMRPHSGGNAVAMPKPEARSQIEKTEAKASSKKQASRLPDDWIPSEADFLFAANQAFDAAAIRTEADKFRDYWISKSGRDAAKQDWPATWRNWIRNSTGRRGQEPQKPKTAFQQHQDEAKREANKALGISDDDYSNFKSTNIIDLAAADFRSR